MVIPVCLKCEQPVNIVATLQDGIEIITFQCSHCHYASSGFLLGYLEPTKDTPPSKIKPTDSAVQRAELFAQSTQSYKLRAKMQGLVDLKNDNKLQNLPPTEPVD